MILSLPSSTRGSMIRVILLVLALVGPTPLLGQSLRGVLLDDQTGAPIAGAFVTLHDSAGKAVTAGPADSAGEFRFVIRPGTYSVHAQRIGYQSFASERFPIVDDSVVREFRMPVRAIVMPPIEVNAPSLQCRGRQDLVDAAAAIWGEARKALEVAAWTNRASQIRYQVKEFNRTFNRSLKLTGERTRDGEITRDKGTFFTPPEARVLQNGFIQLRRSAYSAPSAHYYGPDADVLLSDEFQERYCFRAVAEQDRPGLVGVAFEELVYSSTIGITGVLWIDAANYELRRIDFKYTHLPWEVAVEAPHGSIHFQRLPEGLIIVERWSIFAPTLQPRASRNPSSPMELRGYSEVGSQVTAAYRADGSRIALPDR